MRSWRSVLLHESLATARTGVGVVMLLAPELLPRVLGVDATSRASTSWAVQMLGAREVALGAGVLAAHGTPAARSWSRAGSACDVVDAVVVGAAVRRGVVAGSWGGAIAASALAAGVAGVALAGRR